MLFNGQVKIDEAYIGGKEHNKHANKKLRVGRGSVGKQVVMGIKNRNTGRIKALPIDTAARETLLKHGHYVTYHHFSVKHLHRYIDEFAEKHNTVGYVLYGTLWAFNQVCLLDKRLTYAELKGS